MPRFDADRTPGTHLVLALTVIIAVVAVAVGVKDYVQQKKANPPASTSNPSARHSNADNLRKKTTSAKTRLSRMSISEANAPATQSAADNMEKALIRGVFPKARAKTLGVIDNVRNTISDQAAHDAVETAMDRAAMDRNNRMGKQFGTITACVPLPNGTKPGDADAAYYQNWAREYACVF